MFYIIFNFIIGILMIGLGFLIKSTPNLIAGYNTMPKEKKENVDIEGLSTFMRNGFIVIGISIIIGYFIFKLIGLEIIANSIVLIAILVGVSIMIIKAQKFDHNKSKNTTSVYFIVVINVLVLSFAIGLLAYGCSTSKPIYNNDTIRFSGMYGFEINIGEIENIELSDELPKIKVRSNGFSYGSAKKGFFTLDNFGKSRLLVHSDLPPYLIITKNNDEKIIINFKDKTETENTYNKIKTMMNDQ